MRQIDASTPAGRSGGSGGGSQCGLSGQALSRCWCWNHCGIAIIHTNMRALSLPARGPVVVSQLRLQPVPRAERPPTCSRLRDQRHQVQQAGPGRCTAAAGAGAAAAAPARRQQRAAHPTLRSSLRGSRRSVAAQAGPGGNWSDRNQRKLDNQILLGAGKLAADQACSLRKPAAPFGAMPWKPWAQIQPLVPPFHRPGPHRAGAAGAAPGQQRGGAVRCRV